MKQALSELKGHSPQSVRSIGVSGQQHGMVVLNEDKEVSQHVSLNDSLSRRITHPPPLR